MSDHFFYLVQNPYLGPRLNRQKQFQETFRAIFRYCFHLALYSQTKRFCELSQNRDIHIFSILLPQCFPDYDESVFFIRFRRENQMR